LNKNQKGRKAWLVLWEGWHGNGEYLEKLNLLPFVCVLPPGLGERTVLLILQTLWTMLWPQTLGEKVAAGSSSRRPKPSIPTPGRNSIYLGHDPFLTAHYVENLRVERNESGEEDLYFVFPEDLGVSGAKTRACHLVLRHGHRQFEPDPKH
jgi:hypothetical protein